MTLLEFFVGIIALSNLIFWVALAIAAIAIKRLVNKNIKPVIGEVHATIQNVHGIIGKVDDKTQKILEISEETARKVSGNVVSATDMMQKMVTSPLINISSIATGIAEAVKTLKKDDSK